jgi:hypothetical protein
LSPASRPAWPRPLPLALAELKKAASPGQQIMPGFDRGGACAQVFTACREAGAHWVTCRRAPLAAPSRLPVLAGIPVNGKARQVAWAGETVQIKDYGQARQLTLSERGRPALQVLTSDEDGCAAEVLSFLKSRWREENFLKYRAENYGIDKICDSVASIEASTKITENPARRTANAAVRAAEAGLAAARQAYAVMLADPVIPAKEKNARLIPAAGKKIARVEDKLAAAKAARDKIPANLPANQTGPAAQAAILRAGRRGLQMVLRLLAHNAGHWLATRLNAYLQDDDDYRAITRETVIRGLAGTITYTPDAITVSPDPPRSPRIAPALAPAPGRDQRRAARHPRRQPAHHLPALRAEPGLTTIKDQLPEIWDQPGYRWWPYISGPSSPRWTGAFQPGFSAVVVPIALIAVPLGLFIHAQTWKDRH